MSAGGGALSLADLAAHDPRARPWSPGHRARYCCPLPECQGKKVDAAHRTLTVYAEGGWTCARCKAKGKLRDAWEDRRPEDPRRARRKRRAAYPPPPVPVPEPREPPPYDFAAELRGVSPIAGTVAAGYLESRGIPSGLAHRCGVRFAPRFGSTVWVERDGGERRTMPGSPAVVFALRDLAGGVVGMQGRVPGAGAFWPGGPNKRTLKSGAGELGIFATPGAFDRGSVVVTEAPIDALTLHLCGVPAIATVGTSCPAWLVGRLALRRVCLAHDDDEAGDRAAAAFALAAEGTGVLAFRLRPPEGCKDWNAALASLGRETLAAALASVFAPSPPADVDPFEDPD